MENKENDKGMTYAEAVRELDAIVARMEGNQCDIDSLAAYTTRALELLRFCKERLFKVDGEVTRCLEALKDTMDAE